MASRVTMICDSYESGFGHGMADDGLDLSKSPHADPELGEAYQIGYDAGRESRLPPTPDWLPPRAQALICNRAEDNAEVVSRALRMAWHLGQTYWQQADSEYTSQHRKADETQGKFRALVDETRSKILSLSANPPEPEPAPRRQGPAP